VRRVSVLGPSGSGKTTVGRALAEKLGVPFVELDALHWGPGWTEASSEELRAKVEPIVARDRWVIDGSYRGKIGHLVVDRAEIVLWLDLPLSVTFPRLLRRTVNRIAAREEFLNGNRESVRSAFLSPDTILLYALRNHAASRRRYEARLPSDRLVRLRTQAEIDRLLEAL
jgi:adenylate kinase family enzyme